MFAYTVIRNSEVNFMGKPLIMVTSITYAMKGRNILNKRGIKAEVVRTPKGENKHGCGYSIYVPNRSDEAIKILENNGIQVLGRVDKADDK